MRIAVTGAFSYSGKYVTRGLLERGEEVITLTGHPHRPDPFNGQVKAYPLDFNNGQELIASLSRTEILVNTYWVRFDRAGNTQPRAVENTHKLIDAARQAGVKRVVHISITNPSADSPLPYFRGKAENERTLIGSGLSYAILRPTVLVGSEDILINNIAYLLRRFPFFFIPGDGSYRLQPVIVSDLADLVVEAVYRKDNYIIDTVGPDVFTFRELVGLIANVIDAKRPLISVHPRLALLSARFLSLFVGDTLLTPEEIDGLMTDLLVSTEPPRGKSKFLDWLVENKDRIGIKYASELKRHFNK